MFMWDWFTGMLNYLGKFCLYVHECKWSTKWYLTVQSSNVVAMYIHICNSSLNTLENWSTTLYAWNTFYGFFFKCDKFYYVCQIHACIFAYYSQIFFTTCYSVNTRHTSKLSCVCLQCICMETVHDVPEKSLHACCILIWKSWLRWK